VNLAPFRAVIFDCDGVLVDSEALGLRSLQEALREVGVECSLQSLSRFTGRSHRETLAELEAESGVSLLSNNIAERMDECYMRLVGAEGLRPFHGVPPLLAWLAAQRIPFTLASSGPRRKVQFSLQSAGLDSAFPQFLCGDDVPRAKPAPDLYLAAASLLRVSPAECLAVEDAPTGISSASAAGMQVVGITSTFKSCALWQANIVLESVSLLRTLMEDMTPFAASEG
jgi:beta-phosphoglucomutase-like phosphatase (HAD superfamily)